MATPYERLQRTWEDKDIQAVREFFHDQFWIAPHDLIVKDDVVLNPGWTLVSVGFNKDCLPPLQDLNQRTLLYLESATRSRLAQCGIHVDPFSASENLALGFDENIPRLKEGAWLYYPVALKNVSGRRIRLPANEGVFRLYSPWAAKPARNEELRDILKKGKVQIHGSEGADWHYVTAGFGTVAINLTVDPKSWRYVPSNENEPFTVPQGHNYREALDQVLLHPFDSSALPQGEVFWVCESRARVTIANPSIHATIPERARVRDVDPKTGYYVPHLNSLLVNGGETDWPLRFELLCSVEDMPNHIRLDIFQNKEPEEISTSDF